MTYGFDINHFVSGEGGQPPTPLWLFHVETFRGTSLLEITIRRYPLCTPLRGARRLRGDAKGASTRAWKALHQ